MKPDIRLDMRLASLMNHYPSAENLFTVHGLGQLVTQESLASIGPFLSLETALSQNGISPQSFLTQLQEYCREAIPKEAALQLEEHPTGATDLLALMTCGLKMPFARALEAFLYDRKNSDGDAVTSAVVSNLNHEHSYYPYVNHIKRLEDLPDIIISSDFNPFFYHSFYHRFVRPGYFTNVMDHEPNAAFAEAGIVDPRGDYHILCVNPLIIVADLEKAGTRPLPRCWADLLDPVWRKSITLRGGENFFCHAVLLPLYKAHGLAGIQALAENVFDGRHPAQMVKSAGGGRSAALYVMPDFFARKITDREKVAFIWPEDGALASPVTLLVKKETAARQKPIIDYITGGDLARVFADAHFPSPHPVGACRLPAGARLNWLGWDFIHDHDLEQVNAEIDRVFLPAVQGRQG